MKQQCVALRNNKETNSQYFHDVFFATLKLCMYSLFQSIFIPHLSLHLLFSCSPLLTERLTAFKISSVRQKLNVNESNINQLSLIKDSESISLTFNHESQMQSDQLYTRQILPKRLIMKVTDILYFFFLFINTVFHITWKYIFFQ